MSGNPKLERSDTLAAEVAAPRIAVKAADPAAIERSAEGGARTGGSAFASDVAPQAGDLRVVISEMTTIIKDDKEAAIAAHRAAGWSVRLAVSPRARNCVAWASHRLGAAFGAGWYVGGDQDRMAATSAAAIERERARGDLAAAQRERLQVPANQAWLSQINDRAVSEFSQTEAIILARHFWDAHGVGKKGIRCIGVLGRDQKTGRSISLVTI